MYMRPSRIPLGEGLGRNLGVKELSLGQKYPRGRRPGILPTRVCSADLGSQCKYRAKYLWTHRASPATPQAMLPVGTLH